jgi:glucose/arabinose dehydrogenase/cytochrome c5
MAGTGNFLGVGKTIFLLAAGISTAIACSTASQEPTPAASNESAVERPLTAEMKRTQSANVTRTYNENCANCHGENGQGGGAGTKTLNTKEKFDQKNDKPFFDAIKNGVTDMGMAAFGGSMSDEMIWGLVVHIRELQARALRAEFGSPKAVNGVYSSQRARFRVEDVVTGGLRTPWSLDWLPDGKMLVTNRPGGMYVYDGGQKIAEVEGMPASVEQGQGGLMEVRVHPTNGWVYISVADPAKSGRGAMTKLYRGKVTVSGGSAKWADQETIFEADQKYYSGAGIHFGSKIDFRGDYIYFSVGERGTNMRVQNEPEGPYGKVMRLHLDGKVPADNPVSGNPMWSTGHRNQQGLAFDLSGNLWDTEHGPRGGDEVNLIKKGANYGWPVRAFSINYSDQPFQTPWNKGGESFTLPVFRWLPSTGASGLALVDGAAFADWKGDLIAGGLVGNNVDRFRMKDGALVEHEEILHGLGRVRDINVHRDGTVYIALNGPDKVIRLVPARS